MERRLAERSKVRRVRDSTPSSDRHSAMTLVFIDMGHLKSNPPKHRSFSSSPSSANCYTVYVSTLSIWPVSRQSQLSTSCKCARKCRVTRSSICSNQRSSSNKTSVSTNIWHLHLPRQTQNSCFVCYHECGRLSKKSCELCQRWLLPSQLRFIHQSLTTSGCVDYHIK